MFCIVALLICGANTFAQTWPFELWHEGKIVLVQGDTLTGLVKYDLAQDLVQHASKDKVAEVYSARKVTFFEIYDTTVPKYRQFFTLPFATTGAYKAPIFFELLADGKMTLLAREFLETKLVSSAYYYGPSYSKTVLSHRYFFLNEDGSIQEFTGKKNDLLDLFGKKSKEVEKYIKTNKLRFGEKEDMAKIVSFYNSLFEI